MAALDDVREILRAHSALVGPGPGAPPIANGARVGASLLRAAVPLISGALQTACEDAFQEALPLAFQHFTDDDLYRYWRDCRNWGNPNPENLRRLFFRLGFPDVLDGLSWQKSPNNIVVRLLDEINQIRNRIAHGQLLSINGRPFRITKPVVTRWAAFAEHFIRRFQPFVLAQY